MVVITYDLTVLDFIVFENFMTLHFPSHKAVITRHARSLFALGCIIQHITAVNLTDETDLEILSK